MAGKAAKNAVRAASSCCGVNVTGSTSRWFRIPAAERIVLVSFNESNMLRELLEDVDPCCALRNFLKACVRSQSRRSSFVASDVILPRGNSGLRGVTRRWREVVAAPRRRVQAVKEMKMRRKRAARKRGVRRRGGIEREIDCKVFPEGEIESDRLFFSVVISMPFSMLALPE